MDTQRQQQSECLNRVHEMTRSQLSRGVLGVSIMDHAGANFIPLDALRTHNLLPLEERSRLIEYIEKDRLAHTFVILKLPHKTSYECHVMQLACPEAVRHAYYSHQDEDEDDDAVEEEKK